ncbi:MAG: hypothetical protein WDN46_24150 [Methylocella sp.]
MKWEVWIRKRAEAIYPVESPYVPINDYSEHNEKVGTYPTREQAIAAAKNTKLSPLGFLGPRDAVPYQGVFVKLVPA